MHTVQQILAQRQSTRPADGHSGWAQGLSIGIASVCAVLRSCGQAAKVGLDDLSAHRRPGNPYGIPIAYSL